MSLHPSAGRSTNNWNAWCNFGGLAAALFTCDEPTLRVAAVRRYIESVSVLLDYYHRDGGCDEGPSYWAHAAGSLFEELVLLYAATGGAVNVYGEEKIRKHGPLPPWKST